MKKIVTKVSLSVVVLSALAMLLFSCGSSNRLTHSDCQGQKTNNHKSGEVFYQLVSRLKMIVYFQTDVVCLCRIYIDYSV